MRREPFTPMSFHDEANAEIGESQLGNDNNKKAEMPRIRRRMTEKAMLLRRMSMTFS
jgi:hypothetical protein